MIGRDKHFRVCFSVRGFEHFQGVTQGGNPGSCLHRVLAACLGFVMGLRHYGFIFIESLVDFTKGNDGIQVIAHNWSSRTWHIGVGKVPIRSDGGGSDPSLQNMSYMDKTFLSLALVEQQIQIVLVEGWIKRVCEERARENSAI